MEPPIPLKGVVLFIAFGTMVFIIVFCFIKRQITRFTLRSSHGPHTAVAANTPKELKSEIERKLRRVKEITCEPRLLAVGVEDKIAHLASADPCHYLYRMKTVDALATLDDELRKCGMPLTRKPSTPLKLYLLDARQTGRPLDGARLDLVEKFANIYEHARHDNAEFTVVQYEEFMQLLQQLVNHVREQCREPRVSSTVEFGLQVKSVASMKSAVNTTAARFSSPSSTATDNSQQRITNYTLADSETKHAHAIT